MGVPAQADGAGQSAAPVRDHRSHRGLVRRARRRPAGGRGPDPPARRPLRHPRLHRAGAPFPGRPRTGRLRAHRVRRGHVHVGPARRRQPAALPAGPGGPRLRRDAGQPRTAHGDLALRRRRGARRRPRPAPRRRPGPPQPRRPPRQRPVPGPGPVLRRPVLRGRRRRLRLLRAARRDRRAHQGRPAAVPPDQPALRHRGGRDPERRALHLLRPRLRPRRGLPEALREHPWPEFSARFLSGAGEHDYQLAVRAWHEEQQ